MSRTNRLPDADLHPDWWGEYSPRQRKQAINAHRQCYARQINPLTFKNTSWAEYPTWPTKAQAKRAARHNAKIMTKQMVHDYLNDLAEDEAEDIDCDFYEDWEDYYDPEPDRRSFYEDYEREIYYDDINSMWDYEYD